MDRTLCTYKEVYNRIERVSSKREDKVYIDDSLRKVLLWWKYNVEVLEQTKTNIVKDES